MKKRIQQIACLSILFLICILNAGCTQDNMDNIQIIVTNYPNEYITKNLYADHATITSIYPDGVDIENYKINQKQKTDFSKQDLFIYNGLIEKERNLAVDLLDLNEQLRIIDTAYVLETDYSVEELWLNPSSLLMMAQNIRLGLEEYISSTYLEKEIDDAYEKLKVELSELDADYRVAVENTDNKTIVVANTALKFLEKFGLEVLCLDQDASEKTVSDIQTLIKEEKISYIYTFKNDKANENVENIINNNTNIKVLELHKLDNLSDEERAEDKDYITIMNENLDLIKQELYQ